jgi:hypothetical protein
MGNSSRFVIDLTVTLQSLAAALGIAWWSAATSKRYWGHSLLRWPSAATISVILLAVAAFRARTRGRLDADPRLSPLIVCIMCYAIFVILADIDPSKPWPPP